MELSQLSRKEIINLHDGSRLGYIGDSDLVIDDSTGQIQSIIVYAKGMNVKAGKELVIPWDAVIKIGDDILVVDISPERNSRKFSYNE